MLQPDIHLMIPQLKSRSSRIAMKLTNRSLCSWRLLTCADKKCPPTMEVESSSSYSQKPVSGPYHKPNQSNPHSQRPSSLTSLL